MEVIERVTEMVGVKERLPECVADWEEDPDFVHVLVSEGVTVLVGVAVLGVLEAVTERVTLGDTVDVMEIVPVALVVAVAVTEPDRVPVADGEAEVDPLDVKVAEGVPVADDDAEADPVPLCEKGGETVAEVVHVVETVCVCVVEVDGLSDAVVDMLALPVVLKLEAGEIERPELLLPDTEG